MYYKKILDALPELIYVTSHDGMTPVFFNRTWYNYTGLTEIIALDNWHYIVSPEDIERVSNIIQRASSLQEPYSVDLRLRDSSGVYNWFLSKANPIFDADGTVDSYVGVSIDINDIKTSMVDMQQNYEQKLQTRKNRIKELENELQIHRSI